LVVIKTASYLSCSNPSEAAPVPISRVNLDDFKKNVLQNTMTEGKSTWSCISTLPYGFTLWWFIKKRDNFTSIRCEVLICLLCLQSLLRIHYQKSSRSMPVYSYHGKH